MESPCVKICQINREDRICVGCGRTIEQIGMWSKYTDKERSDIMRTISDNDSNKLS